MSVCFFYRRVSIIRVNVQTNIPRIQINKKEIISCKLELMRNWNDVVITTFINTIRIPGILYLLIGNVSIDT